MSSDTQWQAFSDELNTSTLWGCRVLPVFLTAFNTLLQRRQRGDITPLPIYIERGLDYQQHYRRKHSTHE